MSKLLTSAYSVSLRTRCDQGAGIERGREGARGHKAAVIGTGGRVSP